ncbi:uncharacterized protein BX663DRAFT_492413 [Cokeromyces recurvatus]|uniref:uncharacterized protein n=1 Tax=Cokeromyces recurvatus TaxID=90255 RepID=UPI00221EF70C|nr:uncharacterized protein BX663DRAFT_492413 [Cokeromyces recurvatus]KAI7907918.1 hypothetical protein BX663DRAFT_492413 [Cokeromyces recurvatus]
MPPKVVHEKKRKYNCVQHSLINNGNIDSKRSRMTKSNDSIISDPTPYSSLWLPPISSLLETPSNSSCSSLASTVLMPSTNSDVISTNISNSSFVDYLYYPYYQTSFNCYVPQPKATIMPMIPYFFHHQQFGIEACMLQLEAQKQQQQQQQQQQKKYFYSQMNGYYNNYYNAFI